MPRRPTPHGLRLIRGNPQRRPMPDDTATRRSGAPVVMPPWLRAVDARDAGLIGLSKKALVERAKVAAIKGRTKMSIDELVDALQDIDPGPRELAWREYAPLLEEIGTLTAADTLAFAMTLDRYVATIQLTLYIAEQGPTYETEGRHGRQVKRLPEVAMADVAWRATMTGLMEFGMTPASNTKIDPREASSGSALEDLLRNGG